MANPNWGNVKKFLTKPANVIAIFCIVLLVVAACAWLRLVYKSPSKTFDRMLQTMLTTSSVIKQTTQGEETQRLEQITQINTSPSHGIMSHNTLTQTGLAKTTVVTENVSSPTYDYVRYLDITTDQKAQSGGDFDFSNIINVWGKSQITPENDSQNYSQNVFGVIPIANLNSQQLSELLQQIKNDKVYTVDYASVKKQRVNGRLTYTYKVTVNPAAYISMLKKLDALVGLDQLKDIRPEQYADAQPLNFQLTVDVWSGQLEEIIYETSARSEKYTGYGILNRFEEPTSSIPINELQSRLQSLQ